MKPVLIKLPRNRVRRNYLGGAGIDALHGETICQDNDQPEEWLGSMVEATNPGLPPVPHEGLASVETPDGNRFLRDLVAESPDFFLGQSIRKDGSTQLSFLFKILDSAMRLHVQAHPTTAFANQTMNKPYGKLECYYILGVRKGIDPYIRLGFQHAPTRESWREIIETQNMERMDSCFEKIPVSIGEIWYIPGGMPHAIGEGITMLEIMEPSDLVVRCEFEREGIVVPEAGRFMQRGLDFCLDIFDYTQYSPEEITRKCRVTPTLLSENENYRHLRLIDETLTPCFFVEKLEVNGFCSLMHNHRFTIGVLVEGSCSISSGNTTLKLVSGDSFLLAAAADSYSINGNAHICYVYPGKDMER